MSQDRDERQGYRVKQSKSGPVLQVWQIRLARRLGQLNAPGVYPLTLIIDEDGQRSIVVQSGQKEVLGQ